MSCQVRRSLRDSTATITDKPHGTTVYGDKDRICRGMIFIIERSYGRVCYVAFRLDVTACRAVRRMLGLPQARLFTSGNCALHSEQHTVNDR